MDDLQKYTIHQIGVPVKLRKINGDEVEICIAGTTTIRHCVGATAEIISEVSELLMKEIIEKQLLFISHGEMNNDKLDSVFGILVAIPADGG